MISQKRNKGLTSFTVDKKSAKKISSILGFSLPENNGLVLDYSWNRNTLEVSATETEDFEIYEDISEEIKNVLFTDKDIIEWMWRENVE